jgi:phenylpropionate dioxygenase-like ring-hydroxylating dioxygenase large terminal subunit
MAVTSYASLVQDRRVHGRLYRDSDIFEEELEKIWRKVWLYVGHESEISQPGDYCTKYLGLEPVIMVRDKHGVVRVLFNRCPHRGNEICEYERGNSAAFRCPYHGWTFDTSGALIGVPYQDGYGPSFDRSELGLTSVPRVRSHRGFVFASVSPSGESLDDHLGPAKAWLDQLADLSPLGEIELTAGWHRNREAANWKTLVDADMDGYHPAFVHQGIFKSVQTPRAELSTPGSATVWRATPQAHVMFDNRDEFRARDKMLLWFGEPAEEEFVDYIDTMQRRYGRERARQILVDGPPFGVIFPNLFLAEMMFCPIRPISVSESVHYGTPVMLKGAPANVRVRSLRQFEGAFGPAGLIHADDAAMCERTARGLRAQQPAWLDLRRGVDRERADGNGIRTGDLTDELPLRAFWRRYKQLMSA